jgi:hypothetical protein
MAAPEFRQRSPQSLAEEAVHPSDFSLWFDPYLDGFPQTGGLSTLRLVRHPLVPVEDLGQEEVSHPLKTRLWEALTSAMVEKHYVPDRARQKQIFDRMPWDTLIDEVTSDGQVSVKGESSLSGGAGKMIRGRLFELLVESDTAFGLRSPLEKELLTLAHAPEKFGLEDKLGRFRNPDMAFLLLADGDKLIIEGVGETKLGLLNERAFKQLSDKGFRKGVDALAAVINALPEPLVYGLVEASAAKEKLGNDEPLLTISPDFRQLLVVPANRKIEWVSTLLNRRDFTNTEREAFQDLLSDHEHVVIAQAAFSTAEVSNLAKELTKIISEEQYEETASVPVIE